MPRRFMKLALAVLAALGVLSSSAAATSSSRVIVRSASIEKFGTVLVDSKGYALYVFGPDNARKMTCTAAICESIWPPLKSSGAPEAAGKVKQKLLGSDPDPAGGRVVTYDGWPLYTFAGDTKPGEAVGQYKMMNGGYWWLITPSGKLIKTRSPASSAPIVGD